MKNNIKFNIIILATILLMTLSGCNTVTNQTNSSEEPVLTATEIYQKAMLKQKDVKTADIAAEYKMKMNRSGSSDEIVMNTQIKFDMTDSTNFKMATTGTMTVSAQAATTMSQIFVDNILYVESGSMKYKSKVDADVGKSFIGDQNTEDIFGFGSFSEINVHENGDNGDDRILNFKCDADQINGFVKNIIDKYSGEENGNYSLNEITGSFIVDNNYNIKSMNIDITLSSESGEEPVTMNLIIDLVLNSFGQPVEITVPADAASYVEVDASSLGITTET